MPSRILSYILFWLLMTLIILGSILVVFGLYLPFVAIKAVIMGLCGKIGGATRATSPPAHKGAQDPTVHPADPHSSR